MILIDGKKAAAELRLELKEEVSELKQKYNQVPGLTVILIGDLTPSRIYVRNKAWERELHEFTMKMEPSTENCVNFPNSWGGSETPPRLHFLRWFVRLLAV